MIGQAPICLTCKNFNPVGHRLTCKAFPNGIPDDIIFGEISHRRPVPGDNGIRYEEGKPTPLPVLYPEFSDDEDLGSLPLPTE